MFIQVICRFTGNPSLLVIQDKVCTTEPGPKGEKEEVKESNETKFCEREKYESTKTTQRGSQIPTSRQEGGV